MCTYLEPEFKFVPYQNYWIEGHITRKVTLMIKDLSPIGVFSRLLKGFRNNLPQ